MNKKLIYSLLILNLVIILFFWWQNSGPLMFASPSDFFISIGRLLGLLAVVCVLMQYVFMGRSKWIEETFGLDKLARIHHLNGYLTIGFVLLHPIFITLGYALSSKSKIIPQFLLLITSYEDVLSALLAVLLFSGIVFLSIAIVRKKLMYEVWYFIHLLTYLAVVLAWGHQLENGADFLSNKIFVYYWYGIYILVFGNFIFWRFGRPIYNFLTHQFTVEKIVKENDNVHSIYITGENMENFHVQPGQFMIFKFLNRHFFWQSHPFSLSHYSHTPIRITPKTVGDFTSNIDLIKPGTKVIIDGPYGTFTQKSASKNKIALIAGGIGITPIRALLEQMAEEKKEIIFIYANKEKKDILFRNELDALEKKYSFKSFYILSREQDNNYLSGHLDQARLQQLIPDMKERDIYVCGPIPMTDSIRNDLKKLNVPSQQIHFEKFAL